MCAQQRQPVAIGTRWRPLPQRPLHSALALRERAGNGTPELEFPAALRVNPGEPGNRKICLTLAKKSIDMLVSPQGEKLREI
jgi:hypothetical protein